MAVNVQHYSPPVRRIIHIYFHIESEMLPHEASAERLFPSSGQALFENESKHARVCDGNRPIMISLAYRTIKE